MTYTFTCPICGKRDMYEFRFGREDHGPEPAQEGLTPETYHAAVRACTTQAGPQKEWWCHKDGCGVWFTYWRDTTTIREVAAPEEKK